MTDPIGSAINNARTVIEGLVRTRWTNDAGQLLTPVRFQDALKLESAGGELEREPEKLPWLKVDILWGDSFAASFGPGSLNRNVGVAQVTLFYPKHFPAAPGAAGVLGLADKARTIFAQKAEDECNGLLFQPSSLPDRQPDEGAWKVSTIRTDFEFWEAN